MPKIYAKLKLIILKDSVNSEYFLGEFMVSGLSGPNETLTLKGVRMMHLEWFWKSYESDPNDKGLIHGPNGSNDFRGYLTICET